MSADELFEFRPTQAPQESRLPPWKVLSVEDDPDYQASLLYALKQIQVDDRPIEVLCARSAIEAARILPEHMDIAIILLDVVMERDDAGLRLVRTIRDVICNNQVRIVLLTGQPGMAPQPQVLREYEIDDYWCKSDMTHEHLTSVITGNLRTWERTSQLERARQGLQLIAEASQALGKRRDLESYTQTLLDTLSQLLRVDHGGIICVLSNAPQPLEDSIILAACGPFHAYKQQPLKHLPNPEPLSLIQQALQQRRHLYTAHHTVLHFASEQAGGQTYITLIQTDQPPSPAEINLLDVFCENISTGFANLALYNQVARLAFQDSLLELPNRTHLKQILLRLSTQERNEHVLWVIKLDELNETALYFGEAFCDRVLHSIKARLQTLPGQPLVLARLDRDTFAMLLAIENAPPGVGSRTVPQGPSGYRRQRTSDFICRRGIATQALPPLRTRADSAVGRTDRSQSSGTGPVCHRI
jgi:PleD family two-component response regulator